MAKKRMSINARFEYLRSMQDRYHEMGRTGKGRLLDEMQAATGLSRNHLITQMNNPDLRRRTRSRERDRHYGDDVAAAIAIIADTLDWICPERLQPVLGTMAKCLMRWEEMDVSDEVLEKLNCISISTVGRILNRIRPSQRLPRAYPGRRVETSAQQAVPISVIPWDQSEPGHFEVDLVHHGAPREEGRPIYTIQFIDVLTGWSERFAIRDHSHQTIWRTIKTFQAICPIPIRELHSDNGGEFINQPLISIFGEKMVNVSQTRGRPGRHNDNRIVEQKNSSLVRAYFGYTYRHTLAELDAMNTLYQDMRLYYNLFQPVLRQIERTAVTGANGVTRIRRKQDRARTPLQRLIEASPPISRQTRQALLTLRDTTNPLHLKRSIHRRLEALNQLSIASQNEQEAAMPV